MDNESQFCWNFQRTGHCPRGQQCKWIHELILLPWPSPSIVPMPMPLIPSEDQMPTTPEGCWDQFDENRRLFNTTSTFDPSMSAYTTPLVIESLTPAQIAKAEELSRVPLPSERVGNACSFCHADFSAPPNSLVDHFLTLVMQVLAGAESGCSEDAGRTVKSVLKRKSWIVVQEMLPVGLVSQIESLYKRQITSSTNLQMMIESVRDTQECAEAVKAYLLRELVSVVIAQVAAVEPPKPAKPAATSKPFTARKMKTGH